MNSPSSRPRIVLVDVDGTLVTYANELPSSAVEAIRRARRLGHRVYPTTGRSRAEMPDYLWDIGLDGMIGGNGSYVEHQGEVLLHQHLSREDCQALVAWLSGRGLELYLEANSGLFPSPGFRDAALPAVRAYAAGRGHAGADSVTVEEVFPNFIYDADLVRDDVNKISYLLSGPEDLEAARQAFPWLRHGSWGGRGHDALFGDVGVAGVSKAHAADVLLEHLSASLEDAIAVGDATVDLDMIEHCGTGVAMGNASREVKAAANLVTDDVEEDGLAKAFDRLGLLG
ncbi:Cof-type HAD-IIB family hydrolase [Actinomyces sp. 2119]|uniref:Cof-type HAD-IIB family hydrolase n=1 Tax=Actinomyces sp. 2119 TaxID=2321393 RepID=UPI000E6CCFB2|nr:Cof-type HAD-IIB family hydrolase [Actinomyces sp. 2119]RJF44810.1 Cof-type HAD-IIB family hydrolase [Actinomyces sp. 2119]